MESLDRTLPLVAGIMLLLAIPPIWPYSYYILLRWVVSASAIYMIYSLSREEGKDPLLFLFGVVALLFNPIIPVHLSKGAWTVFNLLAGLLFLIKRNQ